MPNSSEVTLICRRSAARMVPSWIGISYCLPVRLSVIVSVSAIESRRCFLVVVLVRGRFVVGIVGHTIVLGEPPPEVRHPAAFAAEWPPWSLGRQPATVHTKGIARCQTVLLNREGGEHVNRCRRHGTIRWLAFCCSRGLFER